MTAAETSTRLPAGSVRACFHCGGTPEFQLGPELRACAPHVADVLTHYFDTWDGWVPCAVAPIAFGAPR